MRRGCLVTDVLGQPVCPFSKGQAVQEEFLEKAIFAHVAKSFPSSSGQ